MIRPDTRWMGLGSCVVGLALALSSGCAALGDRAHDGRQLSAAEQRRASCEDVLHEREQSLPSDHNDVQSARVDLAEALVELGLVEEARDLLDRALVVLSITLPDDHPFVLSTRSLRAQVALAQDDAQLARLLLESVVAARERILPPDHPDLTDAREKLAGATEASAKK